MKGVNFGKVYDAISSIYGFEFKNCFKLMVKLVDGSTNEEQEAAIGIKHPRDLRIVRPVYEGKDSRKYWSFATPTVVQLLQGLETSEGVLDVKVTKIRMDKRVFRTSCFTWRREYFSALDSKDLQKLPPPYVLSVLEVAELRITINKK